ncbi:hypothetical protein ERJ75_000294200 [Trypanosoma vivax]|nr:hypothetical protein ERJ75_000294200 [Trypanosoma vivax]
MALAAPKRWNQRWETGTVLDATLGQRENKPYWDAQRTTEDAMAGAAQGVETGQRRCEEQGSAPTLVLWMR